MFPPLHSNAFLIKCCWKRLFLRTRLWIKYSISKEETTLYSNHEGRKPSLQLCFPKIKSECCHFIWFRIGKCYYFCNRCIESCKSFKSSYDLVTWFDLVKAEKVSDLQRQEIHGLHCSYNIAWDTTNSWNFSGVFFIFIFQLFTYDSICVSGKRERNTELH